MVRQELEANRINQNPLRRRLTQLGWRQNFSAAYILHGVGHPRLVHNSPVMADVLCVTVFMSLRAMPRGNHQISNSGRRRQ